MAHGYPDGKYRGGNPDRTKKKDGPGKNAPHDKTKKGGETHSRTAKGNKGSKDRTGSR